MGGSEACRSLAFIVEGATEKVFYLEHLSQLCAAKGLISHLGMAEIRTSAPVPLGEVDRAVASS